MTTVTTPREKYRETTQAHVASGAAAATFISSGIGVLVLGLMTTGAVLSAGLKDVLNLWNPAGPLTGKSTFAIIAWLISWVIFNYLWKGKETDLRKSFIITLVLIGLGLLFTFPPVFEAFE
ncbi:MAG TPA: hypothetical protein EYH05_11570 [Anaerolineae bacterium]|nr:hypothetical protein [Anaerolineae bacterium]